MQERQPARLFAHIPDHHRDQIGVDGQPGAFGRADDGPAQLGRREWQHKFSAEPQQVGQPGVQQWAVVKISAQRDDQPQAAARVAHSRDKAGKQMRARRLSLDQRKDLLELIDHEH